MPTNVDTRFRTPTKGDGAGLRPHEVIPVRTTKTRRDAKEAGRAAHLKDLRNKRKAPPMRRPFDFVKGLFRR